MRLIDADKLIATLKLDYVAFIAMGVECLPVERVIEQINYLAEKEVGKWK